MTSRKNFASRAIPPERLDRLVRSCFQLLDALYDQHHEHETIFEFAFGLVGLTVSLIASPAFVHRAIDPLANRYGFSWNRDTKTIAAEVLVHLIIGLVSYWLARGILPFLYIAKRGIAFNAMGLVGASTTPNAIHDFLSWLLQENIHPAAEKVRIICLSGESLFGAASTTDQRPLRNWALRGKLDVIMPVSSPSNPTICERIKRYSPELKISRYPNTTELVREIKSGKEFLRGHDNIVTEHDILCMWRVVILQNYCIVQNYFPNLSGELSDHAPTFVYRNTGADSYYQTFLDMFDLIKRHPGLDKHHK